MKTVKKAIYAIILVLAMSGTALAGYGKYSDNVYGGSGGVRGLPILGAQVTVYSAGTTSLVTIYKDVAGLYYRNQTTDPILTDSEGYFEFYAPNGSYDLKISISGFAPRTISGIEIAYNSTPNQALTVYIGQYASIEDFLSQTTTSTKTLIVDEPTTLTTGTVIPPNVQVVPRWPGSITIASGQTLTISLFSDCTATFFKGTGTVRFATGAVDFVRPECWGGMGDNTMDSTDAIQAAVDAHRNVKFSGKYKHGKITLSATANIAQTFFGDGPGVSVLTNNSTDDMFYSSGLMTAVTFRNLAISNPATGGHIFNEVFSSFATVENCYITQANPAKSIIRQTTNGPVNSRFFGGRWSANAGSRSAYAIDIETGPSYINWFSLSFDNIMMDAASNDTVPFMYFYNFRNSGAAASWGPTLSNLTMESMGGGGIAIYGALQVSLDHIVFDDLAVAPTNPLIYITQTPAGLNTNGVSLKHVFARSGHSTDVNPDVYLNAYNMQIVDCAFGHTDMPNSAAYNIFRPIVTGTYGTFSNLVGTSTYYKNDIMDNAGSLASTSNIVFNPTPSSLYLIDSNGVVFTNSAPTITADTTIAVTKPVSFITGTTNIEVITLSAPTSTWGAQITLLPVHAFTMTATGVPGSIAKAVTAVVGQALQLIYDSITQRWYPSY